MKTIKAFSIVTVIILVCTLLFSCNSEVVDKYGSLSVSTNNSSKTVAPASTALSCYSYKVYGQHLARPDHSFTSVFLGGTTTIDNLLSGTWEIYAEGYNSEGLLVAQSERQSVRIIQNQSTKIELELEYLSDGTGHLNYVVSIPKNDAVVDLLVAVLTDIRSEEEKTITISREDVITIEDKHVFYITDEIDVGVYRMRIDMYDTNGNRVGYPIIEAVHVYKGFNSDASFDWDKDYIPSVYEPVIDLESGKYPDQQLITISNDYADAVIHYTLDGSFPTIDSPIYTNPIVLDTECILRAFAEKDGLNYSEVVSRHYWVECHPAVPSIEAGFYTREIVVSFESATADALLYYSINGGEITPYSDPISLSETSDIKLFVEKEGLITNEKTFSYVIDKTEPPVFSTEDETLYNDYDLVLYSPGNGVIYYTIDGSEPTLASSVFTEAIPITKDTTVKAFNYRNDTPSDMVTHSYKMTVSNPVISTTPDYFGDSTAALDVRISTLTTGAVIHYTIDGSNPSADSPVYSEPLHLNENKTIKFYAEKENYSPSAVMEEDFTFVKPQPPRFMVGDAEVTIGVYNNDVELVIEQGDASAIYYTLDGTIPTDKSTLYEGPISLSSDTTVNTFAVVNGLDSPVTSKTISFVCSKPTSNPKGDSYDKAVDVTLATETEGAMIYYTLDGSVPTSSSILYEGAFKLDDNTRVRAIAVKDNYRTSDVYTAYYDISRIGAPKFEKSSDTYYNTFYIDFDLTASTGAIYFTFDGSDPSDERNNNRIIYNPYEKVLVDRNMTVKAYSVDSQLISVVSYDLECAAPDFSVGTGRYDAAQDIVLTSETEGAVIHYTLNGSEPTVYSQVYSEPIHLTTDTTVRAIAIRDNFSNSEISEATYEFTFPNAPVLDIKSGEYGNSLGIHVVDADYSAVYYTINGSDPTSLSNVYDITDPESKIEVTGPATVKVMAVKNGLNSLVATEAYTFKSIKPDFNVESGRYDTAQNIVLSSETEGAVIHYTLDGSEPTASSPVYSEPIHLTTETTVKAIAIRDNFSNSEIAEATYEFTFPNAPVLDIKSGEYGNSLGIHVVDAGYSAVYYTTDGSDPTSSFTVSVYDITDPESKIKVTGPATVKVMAVKNGLNSLVATETYTFKSIKPDFSVGTGRYDAAQDIVLTSETEGAVIHYTLNGSEPTVHSQVYSEPIHLTTDTTVRAIAIRDNFSNSEISEATYEFIVPDAPVFSYESGEYNNILDLTLALEGATEFFYTTNGTEPTSDNSQKYDGSIVIDRPMTIKAYAIKNGLDSLTATAEYSFKCAQPEFSVVGGEYDSALDVEIFSDTIGAVIRFTTDGKEPNINSPVYTGKIHLDNADKDATIIKAFATLDGFNQSEINSVEYSFITPDTPSFSYESGVYGNDIGLELSLEGASVIYYTIDGSEPSTSNTATPYSGSIPLNRNTTVKAMAIKNGLIGSTGEASYEFVCEEPQFSVRPGTYDEIQVLALETATVGADIYYTVDGKDPTTASTKYTAPIVISDLSTTVKAIAFRSGYATSRKKQSQYTIVRPTAPLFSYVSGTYDGSIELELSGKGVIVYTLDGSEPSINSTEYTEPIVINTASTVKAKSFYGGLESEVSSASYKFKCKDPTPSNSGSVFIEGQLLYLESDGDIYYTTDGTDPNTSATAIKYSGPLSLERNFTLRAIAKQKGKLDSGEFNNTIYVKVPDPQMSISGGNYYETFELTISESSDNATIRYTTDESDPRNGIEYSGPITVNRNMTIKAIASKDGLNDSSVVTEEYFMVAATPVISITSGTYDEAQTVSVSSPDGSELYYTLDGNEPTNRSTKYTGEITIDKNLKLKCIAIKEGLKESAVAEVVINIKTATPVITPSIGVFSAAQEVAITSSDPNAKIYYTLDGKTPDNTSTLYSGPITVSETTEINAIAYSSGMTVSSVSTASLSFDPKGHDIEIETPVHRELSIDIPDNWVDSESGLVKTVPGVCQTLTAVLTPEVDAEYFWYYDGDPITLNTGIYTWNNKYLYLGSDELNLSLTSGAHSISVIARTADTTYSARVMLIVASDGAGSPGRNTAYNENHDSPIGLRGPYFGYIFYDKGQTSDGWRFLEVAASDAADSAIFGYYRTEASSVNLCVNGTQTTSTGSRIGEGNNNTGSIISAMKSSAYTTTSGSSTTSFYAARLCDIYYVDHGGLDWFLPSKEELSLIYTNLVSSGIVTDMSGLYWSSTEKTSDMAYTINMTDGTDYASAKSSPCAVRPIQTI